jgi:guanylate cyclase
MFARLSRVGADPDDDEDTRLRKSLLVICAVPFMLAGLAWGVMYFALGQPLAAAIPSAYAAISLASVLHFGATRRYRFFCVSQLTLILLLPFFLMLTLGGFVTGSAVVLWALICPLGALLFDQPRYAPRWFAAFLVVVVVSGVLQPYLPPGRGISEWEIFFFVMNLAGVSSIVFLMVSYFVGQKNLFQERSEALLLNVLPKEIAAILKDEQRTIAEQYEGASILFADVVNFTPLSAQMSPVELVELLNEVFSHFDALVEKYGLEKIKTIGDCYMVAAGVPRPRADHAEVLARLALDIRDYVGGRDFRGRRIALRIGLNSGPVVAGVIGRRKFIYDLWGDAVNTASRMESQGEGGTIQITEATHELIKDRFVCEPRGVVDVKGKGEMKVWHVLAEKAFVSGV